MDVGKGEVYGWGVGGCGGRGVAHGDMGTSSDSTVHLTYSCY